MASGMAATEPAAVRGGSSQPCPHRGHASARTRVHVHTHDDSGSLAGPGGPAGGGNRVPGGDGRVTEERNLAGDRKTEQRGDRRGRRGKRGHWGEGAVERLTGTIPAPEGRLDGDGGPDPEPPAQREAPDGPRRRPRKTQQAAGTTRAVRERREGASRWRSAVGKDGRSKVAERASHPGRPPGRRGGVDRARLRE